MTDHQLIFSVKQIDMHGNIQPPEIRLLQRSASVPEKLKRAKSFNRAVKKNRSGPIESKSIKHPAMNFKDQSKAMHFTSFVHSLFKDEVFGQFLYISETSYEEEDETDVEDSMSSTGSSPRDSSSTSCEIIKSREARYDEIDVTDVADVAESSLQIFSFSHSHSHSNEKSLSETLEDCKMQI